MNEHRRLVAVQLSVERIEPGVAMVEAMVVRFDDHTLRMKFVKRIDGLFDGHLYIGQRRHCEQAETPGMRLPQPRPFFIHSARERNLSYRSSS